ncbi:MAG TPA: hypothetical protein VFD82_03000 [Planctomycetota bacterium]|nr:hypothetical protein [Planctomycetota bacterium]
MKPAGWIGRCVLPLLATAMLAAQTRNERTASVGMRARIDEVVLPGTELAAAASTTKSKVVVRVLAVRAHGDRFRYDLEWTGLEPGEYDLAKFLSRVDGSPTDNLPALAVTVSSSLKKGTFEPTDPDPVAPDRLGGYRMQQIAVGVLWLLGLLAILFVGRKWRHHVAAAMRKPTLADRLRPLVEAVAAGRADDAQKAELERLLVAFWRARLDLRAVTAAAAIAAIRQHSEAGALLRQVESWLHMPAPPASFDVRALLAPYRSVSAEDFEPQARPAEAT